MGRLPERKKQKCSKKTNAKLDKRKISVARKITYLALKNKIQRSENRVQTSEGLSRERKTKDSLGKIAQKYSKIGRKTQAKKVKLSKTMIRV